LTPAGILIGRLSEEFFLELLPVVASSRLRNLLGLPGFTVSFRIHLGLGFLKKKVKIATKAVIRIQSFVHFKRYFQFVKLAGFPSKILLNLERFMTAMLMT